jgi:3'-5' exoribonuclease
MGYAFVRERIARSDGFPADVATDVLHLVLSHQGELEWGSPVKPQTLEAIVLHHLDNLDSKVTSARTHLDVAAGSRTGYIRSLQRSLFRRPPEVQ